LNQTQTTYTSSLTLQAQQGYTAYTGAGDVDVIGDLTVRGNDIKNSAGTTLITMSTTNVAFAVPIDFPVYTAAALTAITGAAGWQASVSNSPTYGGKMAYWDTTTPAWRYIGDDSAV
jgi:hypothetical protein